MNTWCEGCNFHNYPYSAQVPINIDGKYSTKTFKTNEDVWDVIKLLIKEVEDMNKSEGKSFDTVKAVSQQLPFFCCPNKLHDPEYQRDISKYMYCKEFGVSPHKGEFSSHPHKWVLKSQIIKSSFHKLEQMEHDKIKRNTKA